MMPDPSAMPACSILVKGTWPGYLGAGRLSAEKLRAVALAAGLVAIEERQIACREGDDGVVGVGDGDTRAGAVEAESQLEDEAAARSPDRARINGASISVFCRRASAAGCSALRAAENRTSTRTDARKTKGEETRQTNDQRNSPAFGAPVVPCRGVSCLAHHLILPSSRALASCNFKRGIRGA